MDYIFDEALGWIVYKARLLMKNKLQKTLKDYDITTEQWSILSGLYTKEGYNQKDLAKRCLKDRAALTRILDILERKELIKRENSSNDRREFLVYMTDKGLNLYEEVLPMVIKINQENVSVFSESEFQQLKDLLNKLILNLE